MSFGLIIECAPVLVSNQTQRTALPSASSAAFLCARATVLLLATVLLGGCQRSAVVPATAKADAPARPVRAGRAESMRMERTVRAYGALASFDQATLSTKVAGHLKMLAVDLGAVVRAGDLVAQIEPDDYKLSVRQAGALLAQARVRLGLPLEGEDDKIQPENTSGVRQTRAVLEEARANRDRIRSLSEQKIISKSEVETADAEYEVALSRHEAALEDVRNRQALVAQRRAELDIARKQLDDTSLHAPFDGAVQERRANLGEYLPASAPVLTLVRMDPLRLRLEVPEKDAPKLQTGQKVRVTVDGSTNVYLGEIKRLSPALDTRSLMLRVEADVPNPGPLRPGSFARAEIILEKSDLAVTVPARAIAAFAGLKKVFVVQEGKAAERSVETGREAAGQVEVLKGIKAGDIVVLDPGNLRNGDPVTVTMETPAAPNSRVGTNDVENVSG